jgi:hypothetical protein
MNIIMWFRNEILFLRYQLRYLRKSNGKGKAIPVTGRGGPKDCETSRLSHFLNT